MSDEFLKWFETWRDPNIGWVETVIEQNAAWAGWQASKRLESDKWATLVKCGIDELSKDKQNV
jgi:hypothetical protein